MCADIVRGGAEAAGGGAEATQCSSSKMAQRGGHVVAEKHKTYGELLRECEALQVEALTMTDKALNAADMIDYTAYMGTEAKIHKSDVYSAQGSEAR